MEKTLITAFHGIGAYRGQRNPIALKKQLDIAASGVEICTADRPIGAFGILAAGKVERAFNFDVWSFVCEHTGERMLDPYDGRNRWVKEIRPETQQDFEDFCKSSPFPYCEAWMRVEHVRAIWVKKWAPKVTKEAAEIIAYHRNLPIFEFSTGQVRIWEIEFPAYSF